MKEEMKEFLAECEDDKLWLTCIRAYVINFEKLAIIHVQGISKTHKPLALYDSFSILYGIRLQS